jgi:hypothetical protein
VGLGGEGRGKETEQGRAQRGQRAGARAMGRRSCRAVPRSRAAAERCHAAAVEAEAAALLRKRVFRLGREIGVGPERRGERVPPGPGRALQASRCACSPQPEQLCAATALDRPRAAPYGKRQRVATDSPNRSAETSGGPARSEGCWAAVRTAAATAAAAARFARCARRGGIRRRLAKREGTRDEVRHGMKNRQRFNAKVVFYINKIYPILLTKMCMCFARQRQPLCSPAAPPSWLRLRVCRGLDR